MLTLDADFVQVLWVAKRLFDTGQVTGSTGNISFRHGDSIYMSATNSCFGRLKRTDFSRLNLNGECLEGRNPSKEVPLHLTYYQNHPDVHAVIHTHSFNATVWSSLTHADSDDAVPSYTPYLTMKLGKIRLVPYAKPGSQALFSAFAEAFDARNGYLLAHHGLIVGGSDIMAAFYAVEELEQSCRVALALQETDVRPIEVK